MNKFAISALILGLAQIAPGPAALAQNAAPRVVTLPREGAQLHLTIAQDDQALVADRRHATLPAGLAWLRLTGVPPALAAESVQPAITGAAPLAVLEQRLLTAPEPTAAGLRGYAGQTVTLLRAPEPPISGTLLAAGDTLLLDTPQGLLLNPTGTFVLPRAEAGGAAGVAAPALEWVVNATAAGPYDLEARYATAGLNWQAQYRATLNATGDRLAFSGWLVVSNRTQADFRQAQLTLQTGKLSEPAGADLLKYPRPVNLPAGAAPQLAYASADLSVAPQLVFRAVRTPAEFTKPFTGAPQTTVRLDNSAVAGLGLSLPAGTLTVWQVTGDGALQQLTQQALPATAPDHPLELELGPAPRITTERTLLSTRQLNPRTVEDTVQITLNNQREQPASVLVAEPLPLGAKITESSTPPARQENGTAEFQVTVPAGEVATLKYVVEVKS